jgi:pullulanase
MKKLSWFIFLITILSFAFGAKPSESARADEGIVVNQIYIHYYRFQSDYAGWNIWMWQNEPVSGDGKSYQFADDDSPSPYQFGGKVSKISLDGDLEGATRIGIIVRLNDWAAKDIDNDRFVNLPSLTTDGIAHLYLVQGEVAIGVGPNDPQGPSKNPKFNFAYFTALNNIFYSVTKPIPTNALSVFSNEFEESIISIVPSDNLLTGSIQLQFELDFNNVYTIVANTTDIDNNPLVLELVITYDGIYDSEQFEAAFHYDGNDLGAHVIDDDQTTFRVWAPISSHAYINLYDSGTPSTSKYLPLDPTATNDSETFEMNKSDNGTFFISFDQNLHGKYYTFSITNSGVTKEVVDPYAFSTGINGLRGMVVDFEQMNAQVEGFSYFDRAENMVQPTDAIIYEIHIRDITSHSSWNGPENLRNTFEGVTYPGTMFEDQKTGFDHIKELGVTHVQIIPIFDFGVVDETRLNEEGYNAFNWGYMPLHFNSPEGSYSTNPFDGSSRIKELKAMTKAFNDEGIRVIMDVVYNHTGLSADSNFHQIIPNYYHRMNPNGSFSNGSGTGNETASERIMMRKFIIDSMAMWSKEYNLGGFRFDLMELHDLETINQVYETLEELDPQTLVFGEPWKGGGSPLDPSIAVGKNNIEFTNHVGAFNDDFRDAVKGSVFQRAGKGFIQGDHSLQNFRRIQYGLVGGVAFEGISSSSTSTSKASWHTSPGKTINYVTAHDNNTLHDKLYLSLDTTDETSKIPALQKQANLLVLTSQGVSFLHAGDEILRSKPLPLGGFDHNSYQSPDSVNQINWTQKVNALESNMYDYYRGMIAFRKAHPSFRIMDVAAIQSGLTFNDDVYSQGIIQYTIEYLGDTYLLIHNTSNDIYRYRNSSSVGGYQVFIDGERASATPLYTILGGLSIRVNPHSSIVVKVDSSLGQASQLDLLGEFFEENTFVLFLIIFLLLAVIFAGVWYFLPLSIKVALTKKMNSVFIKSTPIQSPDTKQTKIKNKKTSKKKK